MVPREPSSAVAAPGPNAEADHFLKSIRLFRGMGAQKLATLEALGHRQAFRLGDVLVARGARPDCAYAILQGSVACRILAGAEETEAARVGPGSTLPALALARVPLTEATWVAVTPVEAFVIPLKGLNDFVKKEPELRAPLQEAILTEVVEHYLGVIGRTGSALAEAQRQWERRRQAEWQKAREELSWSVRCDALEELIATAVHEVNNSLTGALGFTQLLLDRELGQDARRDADVIYRESQRVVILLRRLGALAPRRQPEMRRVSLNQLLDRTLELQEEQMARDGVELVKQFQPDLSLVGADPHQLAQVFLALTMSAEEATGGAAQLRRLVVATRQQAERVQVRFRHHGLAISPDALQDLFDSLSNASQGQRALDLNLCQRIARDHRGSLRAESGDGGGITFVLELPQLHLPGGEGSGAL